MTFGNAVDFWKDPAECWAGCRLIALGGVVFGLLLLSSSLQLASARSNKAQTQAQLNKEACDEYKKADAELNAVYRRITKDYSLNQPFITAMKKAQLAWIGYRDAHVESIFPGDPSQYGSINMMCRCNNLAELTKARTEMLNRWVDGVEEGDVCAGSVRVK